MTRETFEAHVARIRSQLLVIARKKLPQNDAEDAVQNAVLSAWKHLDQLRDDDAFSAWIRQILVNECAQILREQKKRRQIDTAFQEQTVRPAPENELPLNEALDEMNTEERELLKLHHEQGYSIAELSEKLGKSEDVVKMRLYRARKRLRIILISLLILLLGMAIAVGTGLLDVQWFLENRRAEPATINTDHRSEIDVSYTGRYLTAEANDAIWDLETLKLLFTYSLTGTCSDALTVHSGNIGVDGERHDHIWIDDQILPVKQWAQGKKVYTFYLDGWRLNERYLSGSEDYLPDGKGETFLSSLYFDRIDPEVYALLVTNEDAITLQSDIFVLDYATGETIEQNTLTVCISAPSAEEWRTVYEEYYR